MMGFERSDDYQPLFWVRGRPVHVTALLVILHVFALILFCLLEGFAGIDLWRPLSISSDAVLRHGAVWQIVTYAFVHTPSPWFLLDMAFLFFWGQEVERYFGRKTFSFLYSAMLLTPPSILLIRGWLTSENQALAVDGSRIVHLGVFIVFTTIYPNVQFFFGIACKWIATALVAIFALQFVAAHAVNEELVLAGTLAVAFFGTRYASIGGEAFDILGNIRERFPRKTAPRGVKPRLKPRRAVDTPSYVGSARSGGSSSGSVGDRGDVHESIDPLLDKISKHGLASLTNGERATLERARVSLLRKERGG